MRDADFEWDDAKAQFNLVKHKISFEAAREVFNDLNRIEELDDDPDEERWIVTGLAGQEVLVVVMTERDRRIRIISARKATRHEQADYFDNRD